MKRKSHILAFIVAMGLSACLPFSDYESNESIYIELRNDTPLPTCLNDSVTLQFEIENLSSDTLYKETFEVAPGNRQAIGFYAKRNDKLRVRVLNAASSAVLVNKEFIRKGSTDREATRNMTYCKGNDVDLYNL